MPQPITPTQARTKLTEYFDAARLGDYTRSRELAQELEQFIDWAEAHCPAEGPDDQS